MKRGKKWETRSAHNSVPDHLGLLREGTGFFRPKNVSGWGSYNDIWSFSSIIVGVKDGREIPKHYSLMQNFPNPFNPVTVIRYGLPAQSSVKLEVYNTLGQRIFTLVDDIVEAGYHEVPFNASHLPSGVYIYRLQAGGFVESRKLLLLK